MKSKENRSLTKEPKTDNDTDANSIHNESSDEKGDATSDVSDEGGMGHLIRQTRL
jgi:hypothetical protein